MTFRLSHAALEDLQSIDDYTVLTWDAEQADRYLAMLWATFERIAKHPTRWRLRADLHPDCRICFSGRHAILYRLQDGAIEIARVLHDAMDFPVHASDLFPDHEYRHLSAHRLRFQPVQPFGETPQTPPS